MNVMVLGAGLLGVTSAYFLRQQGHDVTVVDRQATPAAETSFANGGQISVSHAEPWANPSAPLKVLKWLAQEDAPLLVPPARRPAPVAVDGSRSCASARRRARAATSSTSCGSARTAARCCSSCAATSASTTTSARKGILHFYTSAAELARSRRPGRADARARLRPARDHGRRGRADRARARHIRPQLAGATYTTQDESGDANRFARELVEHCQADGVRFLMSHTITALRAVGRQARPRRGDRLRRPLPILAGRRLRARDGQLEPAVRARRSASACRSIRRRATR